MRPGQGGGNEQKANMSQGAHGSPLRDTAHNKRVGAHRHTLSASPAGMRATGRNLVPCVPFQDAQFHPPNIAGQSPANAAKGRGRKSHPLAMRRALGRLRLPNCPRPPADLLMCPAYMKIHHTVNCVVNCVVDFVVNSSPPVRSGHPSDFRTPHGEHFPGRTCWGIHGHMSQTNLRAGILADESGIACHRRRLAKDVQLALSRLPAHLRTCRRGLPVAPKRIPTAQAQAMCQCRSLHNRLEAAALRRAGTQPLWTTKGGEGQNRNHTTNDQCACCLWVRRCDFADLLGAASGPALKAEGEGLKLGTEVEDQVLLLELVPRPSRLRQRKEVGQPL